MKLCLTVLAALAVAMSALAQNTDHAVQLEADRKPSLVTKGNVLIQGGRVITVTNGVLEGADVLIRGGKIVAIGKGLKPDAGMAVINAVGKVVTPGIIDAHSHRGAEAINEGSESITSECRIFDVLNPTAKNIWSALASGETAGLVLHGSANCVGGQSTVVKFKYGRPVEELIVPDAPRMVKFALGENVTRSGGNGSSQRFPRTRMGVQALYRRAFTEAREYNASWDKFEKDKASGKKAVPPRKDLRLETLGDILRGKVWVQCHSYRADEMLMMVRLSQEFGFKIGAMQHALEAYQIAPELKKAGVAVSMFADNWAYKPESYNAIPYNAAICTNAGVTVSVNSDSMGGTISMAQDAAKTMRYGGLNQDQMFRLITINPAKELGIDRRAGSLEVGKDGDVAIWDGHPLSVYSRCAFTLIEGEVFFQRPDTLGVDKLGVIKSAIQPVLTKQPALPAMSSTYAIVGATIHPVSSRVIAKGTVVVQNGRITAVGASAAVPAGARVVDGRGLNVYPGFIDAGSSLGLQEIPPIGQTVDERENGTFQPDLIAATAFHQQSAFIGVMRVNGITSTLTRPTGGTISGQASVMDLGGPISEAMTVEPNGALMISLPGGGGGGFGHIDVCDGDAVETEEQAELLERVGIRDYTAQATTPKPPTPPVVPKELQEYFDKAKAYFDKRSTDRTLPVNLSYEALKPYLRGTKPVLIRANSASQIRVGVELIKKNKLKGVLVGASDAWKEAELLAENKVPVILNVASLSILSDNATVSEFDPYDVIFAQAGILKRAGVKFAFQSDDDAMAMNLPFAVGQTCAYGLSKDDAIRALTLDAAEILGVGKKLGSIEVGKVANLVVSAGDPLDYDGRIEYVFIKGQPVSRATKFTRLRDEFGSRK
jgi:imidazolonepropionase-like amidohydrolase